MQRMWHVWPGQQFPFTAAQEAVFVAELEASAVRPGRAGRDDVTAVLGLLRCGCRAADAFAFAPGLRPAQLLGAYRRLARALAASTSAWQAIVDDPRPVTVQRHGAAAAKLFPVAVERVRVVGGTADRIPAVVAQLAQRMDDVSALAARIEQDCFAAPAGSAQLMALSSALFNPLGPSIYADPLYRPDRVASLTPTRAEDLLGTRDR